MRNINLRYVNEAYDEDGVLSSFEVSCPASFNFGYDVGGFLPEVGLHYIRDYHSIDPRVPIVLNADDPPSNFGVLTLAAIAPIGSVYVDWLNSYRAPLVACCMYCFPPWAVDELTGK